jgi:hypothetical protein
MRLGQLARKLEVKPSEIAELLNSKHQLEISVHPNSKIPDEFIQEIKDHFYVEPFIEEVVVDELIVDEPIVAPIENIVEEPVTEATPITKDASEEVVKVEETIPVIPEVTETISPIVETTITPESDEEENTSDEKEPNSETSEWENVEFISDDVKSQADTIKVPKIDLEGLKVVGKIDLPEPKVVTPDEEPDQDENLEEAPVKVSKPMKKSPRSSRPAKRKYTEKEKEEQAEKKKLEAHILFLKEQKEAKKKAHYAKVQEQQKKKATPPKKKKKKEVSNTDTAHKAKKKKTKEVAPTTFWGKFKKWLNDS